MGSGLSVRPYDASRDAAALRACVVEHQDFHRALEPAWPPGHEIVDAYLTYLERQCARHDGQIMLAEADGEIAGFLAVVAATRGDSPDDPAVYAWVHDVFVRSAHRRRGIGTALMRAAEAFADARGATELRLAVLARNVDAQSLYRRLEFRDYARILAKPL